MVLGWNHKKTMAPRRQFAQDYSIINGKNAAKGQFPYQVTFMSEDDLICGGTLYTKNTVITAAHCCYQYKEDNALGFKYDLIAGDIVLEGHNGQSRILKDYLVHEKNDYFHYHDDICLVFPDKPFEINTFVKTLELGDVESCSIGKLCLVSGFGALFFEGAIAEKLQYAKLPILKPKDCDAYKKDYLYEKDKMMCVGYLDGRSDTCKGDSGGPLNCNHRLCGVVSWGHKCAEKDFPGIYTKLTKYIPWIKENTKQ